MLTGVLLLGMAGGTLPSPLYPLYQSAYGFSNATVTVIFAFYGAGVILALLGLGQASDRVGRKPMLLVALGLGAFSTLSFLLADGLILLFVGRFLSGLSIGVLSGTATAGLAELEPGADKRRASIVSGVVTPAGLGIGTILTGAVVEFAPVPFRLVFAIYMGLLAALAVAVLSLPETVPLGMDGARLRMRSLHVPAEMWRTFLVAAGGVFSTFAMMSLFASLVPSFLSQTLDQPGPLVSGGALSLLFGLSAAAPLAIGRGSIGRAGFLGVLAIAAGLGLLAAGLADARLLLLLGGCAVAGFGAGCMFTATLALVNRDAPPARRGEVISAYFVAGYIGVTLPPIAVGVVSVQIGVLRSVVALSILIVTLALLSEVGISRSGPA